MEQFRLENRRLLTVTVILAILIYVIILLISQSITDSLLKFGVVIAIVTSFWVYFEKIGWHQKLFRIGGWLSNIPDIRGRWEGKLIRRGEEVVRNFILEVTQSASKLKVSTYSEHSHSHSINAHVLFDQTEDHVVLIYTWLCNTSNAIHGTEPGEFYGTTILRLNIDNQKKLAGEYFTNRKPNQTSGKLNFELKQIKLKGEF